MDNPSAYTCNQRKLVLSKFQALSLSGYFFANLVRK